MLGLETDVLLVSSDFLYFLTGGLRSVKEGSEAIRCSFMMYFSLSAFSDSKDLSGKGPR